MKEMEAFYHSLDKIYGKEEKDKVPKSILMMAIFNAEIAFKLYIFMKNKIMSEEDIIKNMFALPFIGDIVEISLFELTNKIKGTIMGVSDEIWVMKTEDGKIKHVKWEYIIDVEFIEMNLESRNLWFENYPIYSEVCNESGGGLHG